jgi:two-component system, sensor histidine kinase and response regulator
VSTDPGPTQAPILDPGVLDELRAATGDDEAFIQDLVATYLAEAPTNLEAITAALAAGDVSELVRPAHTLKSSSASIGAMRLAAISRRIEEAGRRGRLDGVAGDLAEASGAWNETVVALTEAGVAG